MEENAHSSSLSRFEKYLRDDLDLESFGSDLGERRIGGDDDSFDGDVSEAEGRVEWVVSDEFDEEGFCPRSNGNINR